MERDRYHECYRGKLQVLWSIWQLFLVEQKDKEGFSQKVILKKTTKG